MIAADGLPVLNPGKCKFCHRPVTWGYLQNGRRRSFEPRPYPVDEVAEGDRFAVAAKRGVVVDLVAVANPPAEVLLTHRCLEYAKARMMRGMTNIAGELADVPMFQQPKVAGNAPQG